MTHPAARATEHPDLGSIDQPVHRVAAEAMSITSWASSAVIGSLMCANGRANLRYQGTGDGVSEVRRRFGMYREHDVVVLRRDLLEHGLITGDFGAMVGAYSSGGYEVEFTAADGCHGRGSKPHRR